MAMYEVRHFRTADGTDVFGDWFDALRDRQAQQRIAVRVDRLALGLFGDAKALREGVRELRIDHGPGYRVYYAIAGARSYCYCAAAKSEGSNVTLRARSNTGRNSRQGESENDSTT